jgi:hypothetical protein
MPRPYILLALLGAALVMSPANAQPLPLSHDELLTKLLAALEKRYSDLAYIFPRNAKISARVNKYRIGQPEPFSLAQHYNLLPLPDQKNALYRVVAQYTVWDRSGQVERKEKDFYCYMTYQQRDWTCTGFGSERDALE